MCASGDSGLPATPQTTLAVVLGASDFPESKLLKPFAEFKKAALDFSFFLLDKNGFGMHKDNFHSFFDLRMDPNTLDRNLSAFIRERCTALTSSGLSARDLLVYYVGHGSFDEERKYFLAISTSRDDSQGLSSIRFSTLNHTLGRVADSLRTHFIIDACFAAAAASNYQFNPNDQMLDEIRRLPNRGTAFLCSSADDETSQVVPKFGSTLFGHALDEVLWEGTGTGDGMLSLREVKNLVKMRIGVYHSQDREVPYIEPQIHNPRQSLSEVSDIPLFPNGPLLALKLEEQKRALQERRARDAEHEVRRVKEAKKIRYAEEQTQIKEGEAAALALKEALASRTSRTNREDEQRNSLIKEARAQAEEISDRVHPVSMLKLWCEWKRSQVSLDVIGFQEKVSWLEDTISQLKGEANNVLDNRSVAEKSGSNSSVVLLTEHWRETQRNIKAAALVLLSARDDLDNANTSLEFYTKLGEEEIKKHAATLQNERSRGRMLSFAQVAQENLQQKLRKIQHVRRTKRLIKRLTRATIKWILIGLLISALIAGLIEKFTKNG